MSGLWFSLVTAAALGVACAVLSVVVVLRRWAFIGEGIAHAGFGGAGTAWLASLLFPGAAWLTEPWGIAASAVAFCFAVALAIALLTRRQDVHLDTAIGIFLVASLAWGFVALEVYRSARNGAMPPEWGEYLLGQMARLTARDMVGAIVAGGAVLATLGLLWKEVWAYCFDPVLAEASGVRVGFVHTVLILLVAVTIVLGMRLTGSLLVVALLVLPGATALLLSRRLGTVMLIACVVGLAGAVAGPLAHFAWRAVPAGPAIVLTLVLEFAAAFAWSRLRRPTTAE